MYNCSAAMHCTMQLCKERGEDLSVCVIEKGAEVGETRPRKAAAPVRQEPARRHAAMQPPERPQHACGAGTTATSVS